MSLLSVICPSPSISSVSFSLSLSPKLFSPSLSSFFSLTISLSSLSLSLCLSHCAVRLFYHLQNLLSSPLSSHVSAVLLITRLIGKAAKSRGARSMINQRWTSFLLASVKIINLEYTYFFSKGFFLSSELHHKDQWRFNF